MESHTFERLKLEISIVALQTALSDKCTKEQKEELIKFFADQVIKYY